MEEEIPERSSSDDTGETVVLAAVIRRGDRYLVGRRPPEKRHGGLWEFPGGKVGAHESGEEAIARELHEEMALTVVSVGQLLLRVPDPGSAFSIHFVEVVTAGTPSPLEHSELAWYPREALLQLDLAPADARFVQEALPP